MNTPFTRRPVTLVLSSLGLVLSLAVVVSLSGRAAETPVKGGELLVRSQSVTPLHPGSVAASRAKSHGDCASCTTVASTKAVASAKGGEVLRSGGRPMVSVASHGCGGCGTTLGVAGHGKAKTDTVSHACTMPTLASMNCCK